MSETTPIVSTALDAAFTVFKSLNGRIAARLGSKWLPGPGAEATKRILLFFKQNLVDLGDHSFGVLIDPLAVGSVAPIDAKFVRTKLMEVDGTVLITTDSHLRPISVKDFPAETDADPWNDRMQSASTGHPVFYFEQRNCVWVFAGGSFLNQFNPLTGEKPGKTGNFSHRALNYRLAIRDHYEQQVKRATACDHWGDASKRILRKKLGCAKKTEEIFQNSLINWLNHAIMDGQTWPEPRKLNRDRADIKLQPFGSSRFYLIEIKWLGTSGGRMTWGISRIRDGLKQLGQYLKDQPCPLHATLVVYDGREEVEFEALVATDSQIEGIKTLGECQKIKVPVGGDCHVFFLFSKQASQL